jgi:hypothetical protein
MNVIRCAAVCLALLVPAGCQKRLPPQADADEARAALTAALDAWKDGGSPEALRGRTPPVDFRDAHWDGGSRLTRYVVKAEERSGVSVRFTVELQLQHKDGTSRRRVVNYNADAGKAVVIRPDF